MHACECVFLCRCSPVCVHLVEKTWGNGEVIQLLQWSMNTACLQMQCTNWAHLSPPPSSSSSSSATHRCLSTITMADNSAQFLFFCRYFLCIDYLRTPSLSVFLSVLYLVIFQWSFLSFEFLFWWIHPLPSIHCINCYIIHLWSIVQNAHIRHLLWLDGLFSIYSW